ncbi:cupin domain-containing protein [Pseudonocardia sp. CA-142604]|uniref:cupin domain-containing protein n=1 Tax=Pseudonocardia sp. CA-142604 TaxID=3240024 RepID=UPI003D900DBD
MTTDEALAGEVIHNPVSGETIVIRQSAAQTGGLLLAWDLRLAPGGRVPSGHTHPGQEERFTIREGRLCFRIAGRTVVVGPGDSVVVPAGTAHHFANVGSVEAVVYVETRPALQMEQLLRTAAGLAQEQRRRASAMPRPVDLMLFMCDFRAEVQAPYLPARLVGMVVRAAARLAETLGADRRYRRLRAR